MARRRSKELTEIGGLFRDKLRELREHERQNQRGRGKRSRAARGRVRLQAVESPPADATLLSTGEVADLLKVTPKTVWRWAHYDGLPTVRTVGGHRRYRWTDVKTWIGA
jgi:excisionase family DNA binding protein